MQIVKTIGKSVLDSWMPSLGRVYRAMRDDRATTGRGTQTPFGFNLLGNETMEAGKFEIEELDFFRKHLGNVQVCIDIGANIGLYSCIAAHLQKHVVAIEPLIGNLKLLYRNLVYNNFLDVEVFPLGLSSQGGIKRLFGGGTMASFHHGWGGQSERLFHVVPVSTLDVIVNTRFDSLPILVKMDVEGFEGEVLKGAERTLNLNPKPIWLVEINLNQHFPNGLNDQFYRTFEVFWQHGYNATIAEAEQRTVSPHDVSRWAKQGVVDFGSHNYAFVKA